PLRNFERAAQHQAANLRRKTRHYLLQPGRNYGGIATKQPFKGTHSGIEHGVMLLEECDKLAHLGFVGRKFACVLCDLDKAIAIACLLYFREQKVQFDKIDVLDFIRTTVDELPR